MNASSHSFFLSSIIPFLKIHVSSLVKWRIFNFVDDIAIMLLLPRNDDELTINIVEEEIFTLLHTLNATSDCSGN